MRPRQYLSLLLVVLAASAILWFRQPATGPENPGTQKNNGTIVFNRQLRPLIYTKHARCRMGCRQIDAEEVEDILEKGRLNDQKSDPDGKPDPKYAVEGLTKDNQQVRIIFAPTTRGMVVITCIDLKEQWNCDCP